MMPKTTVWALEVRKSRPSTVLLEPRDCPYRRARHRRGPRAEILERDKEDLKYGLPCPLMIQFLANLEFYRDSRLVLSTSGWIQLLLKTSLGPNFWQGFEN